MELDGSAGEGPQNVFRITPSGEQELRTWLQAPTDVTAPPRDELVIKILSALRVPGIEVQDVVEAHRRYLIKLMQQWARLKEHEADFDLSLALVVDAELFRLDSLRPGTPRHGPPRH